MRQNKRSHPRATSRNIAAHLKAAGHTSIAVLDNISAGGVFVRTGQTLPEGTPLAVQLARPGLKEPLVISGRVVRINAAGSNKPGMSIAFDPMPDGIAKRVEEILRSLGLEKLGPPHTKHAPSTGGEKTAAATPPTPEISVELTDIRVELKNLRDKLTKAEAALQERDQEIGRLREQLSGMAAAH
jgi:hypothetical protein